MRINLNSKQKKTLEKLQAKPVLNSIKFNEVDKLLIALDCKRAESKGSAIIFSLDGKHLSIHRPHPNNEILKYVVKNIQEFLKETGVIE
ncbi:MAG: HicA protein [Gammaproteobacteria bacterium]|nr:MAG: HicA protein [Gammaproteobacteria bacterium]